MKISVDWSHLLTSAISTSEHRAYIHSKKKSCKGNIQIGIMIYNVMGSVIESFL
jgi:hypothetical protein